MTSCRVRRANERTGGMVVRCRWRCFRRKSTLSRLRPTLRNARRGIESRDPGEEKHPRRRGAAAGGVLPVERPWESGVGRRNCKWPASGEHREFPLLSRGTGRRRRRRRICRSPQTASRLIAARAIAVGAIAVFAKHTRRTANRELSPFPSFFFLPTLLIIALSVEK